LHTDLYLSRIPKNIKENKEQNKESHNTCIPASGKALVISRNPTVDLMHGKRLLTYQYLILCFFVNFLWLWCLCSLWVPCSN